MVFVSRSDQWIYVTVVSVFVLLFLVFLMFKKSDKLMKIWDDYYKAKDKIEGPVDFGPDFFEFITMIVKLFLKLFSR